MKKLALITLIFSFSFSLKAQCVDPSLIDPSAICIGIYDPVCGCDGMTYSNSCWAEVVGGVTSWTLGVCTPNNCLPINYQPGIIPTGVHESTILTRSDGIVGPTEFVVLESETIVDLEPNFQTMLGADFSAEINNCNDASIVIGAASLAANVTQTFYLHYGGEFYFWFNSPSSLCPSSAVEIDIVVNGVSIYCNIVEAADALLNPTPGFMIPLTAPPLGIITINANLVPTTIPGNQNVACFALGNAEFGYSF